MTRIQAKPLEIEEHLAIPVRAPNRLPKPQWLKEGEYNSPVWVVGDDNPLSPKLSKKIRFDLILFDPRRLGECCRLTDPEYAHLLDTAKLQIYGLRTGKHATVTSASAHDEMARAILNWIVWMIMNNIRRFSYLDQDDFDAYLEAACYGPAYLLMYKSRLEEYVRRIREAGIEIPRIKRSNSQPFLDAKKLLQDAGIDPKRGFSDKSTAFELATIAKEEGFYLKPERLSQLSEEPPKPQKMSAPHLIQMLRPWDYQWQRRREFPGDCIQFDPFCNLSPEQMARDLCQAVGRTKTAPIRQTMELIDRSIRWVLDYAPVLLDLRDQFDGLLAMELSKHDRLVQMTKIVSEAVIPEGPGSPLQINASTKRSSADRLHFGTAVLDCIPAACAIVIAAFTGRRHDEALSIRTAGPDNGDCIIRDDHGLWIEVYIEKTIKDWERSPCNELVVSAVEILRRWSAPARTISGTVKLFQYKKLISADIVRFRLRLALEPFVDFLSLTPMPNGSQWNFQLKQFRRFFAILYFWHYQYGDLAALSYQLRHLNPAVTQVYVTEPEMGAIFRHVNREHTGIVLTEAALGERNVSGPFGERFKSTVRKLRDRYRRLVKIVSPLLVEKVVERYVQKSGRRLKAFKWGWCACGPALHQLNTARCLKDSSLPPAAGPDFSQSAPTVCGDCPHHMTDGVFEPFWRNELELHEQAALDPGNGPILREVSKNHAEKLRCQYMRSFMNSNPLEPINERTHQPPPEG